VNTQCCDDGTSCSDGTPATCDVKCALVFNDFFEACEQVLATQVPAAAMLSYRRLYTTCSSGLPVEDLLDAAAACSSLQGCTNLTAPANGILTYESPSEHWAPCDPAENDCPADRLCASVGPGMHQCDGLFYPVEAVVACTGDARLQSGDLRRSCQDDGTWTGIDPVCHLGAQANNQWVVNPGHYCRTIMPGTSSYATDLAAATAECADLPTCTGVYDGSCNGDDFTLCDEAVSSLPESSSGSCVYVNPTAAESIVTSTDRCTAETCVVGTEVVLTADYESYADASSGPLSPGEVGTVESMSSSSGHPRVLGWYLLRTVANLFSYCILYLISASLCSCNLRNSLAALIHSWLTNHVRTQLRGRYYHFEALAPHNADGTDGDATCSFEVTGGHVPNFQGVFTSRGTVGGRPYFCGAVTDPDYPQVCVYYCDQGGGRWKQYNAQHVGADSRPSLHSCLRWLISIVNLSCSRRAYVLRRVMQWMVPLPRCLQWRRTKPASHGRLDTWVWTRLRQSQRRCRDFLVHEWPSRLIVLPDTGECTVSRVWRWSCSFSLVMSRFERI
jgi:hypothetical protein